MKEFGLIEYEILDVLINAYPKTITSSEIAKETKKQMPSVCRALNNLVEKNYCIEDSKVREDGKPVKIYLITFKGFYESMAKPLGIVLDKSIYYNMDAFILHPFIKRFVFNIREKTLVFKEFSSVLSTSLMAFSQPKILNEVNDEMKKDVDLQKAFDNGFKIFVNELKKKIKL